MSDKYSIVCKIGARPVATLSMNGELTILHDNFKEEDGFELEKFITAFDKFAIKRAILHSSKAGVNRKVFETLDSLQRTKPGRICFPEDLK